MRPHIRIPLDEGAIAEIEANLALRVPNTEALTAIARRLDEADGEPVEVVIDIATAVGKTYVAAGLIDYAAAQGVRNFAIVTPSRSILNKTLANFTRGHRKEVKGRSSSPLLVTSEDFTSGSVKAALEDDGVVKLFVFTVQQLIKPNEKTSRRVREFQEGLGQGLYDYLHSVGDLVVIADEHHAYYGDKFSAAIRDLDAVALVGLTATVNPKTPPSEIIYRYPLGRAIADGLVKTPVLVGRKDDRRDIETQLMDGVALLNVKRDAAETYCTRHGLEPVNPVMFIVCQSITDADEVAEILKRPHLFGSNYEDAVLTVHSEAGDAALDALALVEEPESRVRAIVSVSMLKEGWDVKNIFVICALRALASQVLTEQTLGRGLRLPFDKRTGVEMLDTVEVLAHDRYAELLKRSNALIRGLVESRAADAVDPETGVAPAPSSEATDSDGASTDETGTPVASDGTAVLPSLPGVSGPVIHVADIESRRTALARESLAIRQDISIPADTEPFYVPFIETLPKPRTFSLSTLTDEEFENLGRSLAANPDDVLRRYRLDVVATPGGGFEVHPVAATDKVIASVPEMDLGDGEDALVDAMLGLNLVTASKPEKNAAKRLVRAFVRGLGDDAARRLSAFFNTALDTIRQALTTRYRRAPVESEVTVSQRQLVVLRTNTRPVAANLHVSVDRNNPAAYEGWAKSLVSLEWFDSDTERQMAVLLDESEAIGRWVRLHQSDGVVINYQGRGYRPDFAAEAVDGVFWLIETKADKDLTSEEVTAKRLAAEQWARFASDHLAPSTWRYLLVGETDLANAHGNWELVLAQAKARG